MNNYFAIIIESTITVSVLTSLVTSCSFDRGFNQGQVVREEISYPKKNITDKNTPAAIKNIIFDFFIMQSIV